MQWAERTSVRKGSLGEAIVDDYLRSRGLVPYAPIGDGAHPFDRLCATKDKRRIFVCEVKTKARRTYYPDTGINETHFNDYMRVVSTHAISVWLLFADEHERRIYGGSIERLARERAVEHKGRVLMYPIRDRKIIYFPLCAMTDIAPLDEETAEELKKLSRRNYAYES